MISEGIIKVTKVFVWRDKRLIWIDMKTPYAPVGGDFSSYFKNQLNPTTKELRMLRLVNRELYEAYEKAYYGVK